MLIVNLWLCRQAEDDMDRMKRDLDREISHLQFLKDSLQRQKDTLEGELNATRTEINGLKMTIAQLQTSQAGITAELQATKVNIPWYTPVRPASQQNYRLQR